MSDSPSPDKKPGLVCTFYSYKGGVGRSMALANVGVLMATEGHRVLLVDWDLEAPGLEVYFEKAARLIGSPAETPGVIDLLLGHAGAEGAQPPSWRQCLLKAEFFGHSLDILSSGQRNADYRRRVQSLDWEKLFTQHRIGNYIDTLREEWRSQYDFILIDSRTGVTDIGDICTMILPDVLVLLFVTNHQNVAGIKATMSRAVNARSKMPVNRSKLLGVPVPARDERDREYDKSIEWQHIFEEEFGDMYREWLPKEVKPADALNRLFIPYVASWSFGEHIPVIESERERSDPTSLGAAYSRLATLLSHRLDWSAIDARVSASELVGTRVELSKAREEVREVDARRAREARLRDELERSVERYRKWILMSLMAIWVAGVSSLSYLVIKTSISISSLLITMTAISLVLAKLGLPFWWEVLDGPRFIHITKQQGSGLIRAEVSSGLSLLRSQRYRLRYLKWIEEEGILPSGAWPGGELPTTEHPEVNLRLALLEANWQNEELRAQHERKGALGKVPGYSLRFENIHQKWGA